METNIMFKVTKKVETLNKNWYVSLFKKADGEGSDNLHYSFTYNANKDSAESDGRALAELELGSGVRLVGSIGLNQKVTEYDLKEELKVTSSEFKEMIEAFQTYMKDKGETAFNAEYNAEIAKARKLAEERAKEKANKKGA